MRRLVVLVALVGSACAAEDPRILSVTLPGDTRDRVGPYAVEAVIRGVADGDDVEVRWTSDPTDPDLRFVPVPARRVSPSDLFVGEIPGQPPSTRVYFVVDVLRDGAVVAQAPPADDDATYSFLVLQTDAPCRADTDCLPATEICADGACLPYSGQCVDTATGAKACPDGYVCDVATNLCAIAP